MMTLKTGTTPAAPPSEFTVAGRTFRLCRHTSALQDTYITKLLSQAQYYHHADQINNSLKGPREQSQAAVQLLIEGLYESGTIFSLIGALVDESPFDVKWSKEASIERGEFFGDLTAIEDKEEFADQITGVVIGFFVTVTSFSQTLDTSSSRQPLVTTKNPGGSRKRSRVSAKL